MCSSTTAERQSLASRDRTCCLRRCLPARPLRYYGFRGSIAHPTQSLCTLRTRRRRRPRNTRYRAPATAYPDRSLTGRTTPAYLAHKQSILSLRGEMDCFVPLAMTAPGAHSSDPLARNDGQPSSLLVESSGRDRRRHGQKRPGHVPEQLPVGGERDRVRRTRKDDELPVAVWQQIIELLKVGDGGDAVIFAAHQQHRRKHLFRAYHRQIGGHVEIGAGRNLVAELHFHIRQHFDGGGIAGAGLVAGGDGADHVATALAHF